MIKIIKNLPSSNTKIFWDKKIKFVRIKIFNIKIKYKQYQIWKQKQFASFKQNPQLKIVQTFGLRQCVITPWACANCKCKIDNQTVILVLNIKNLWKNMQKK